MNVCQTVPSNLGNRFAMRLEEHEGHTLCKVLVKLGAKEEGENFTNAWYSEVSHLTGTGTTDAAKGMLYDYIVPATWLVEPPRIGTFKVTYTTEKPELVQANFRRKLGEEYLNWRPMQETTSGD